MTKEKLIRTNLIFLEEKFNFKYSYTSEGGNNYFYTNEFGTFRYYEWEQFGEKEFTIKTNQEIKTLDTFFEYHKLMSSFKFKKKSLKNLFKNMNNEYWYTIGEIIKEEIAESGSLFGLKL